VWRAGILPAGWDAWLIAPLVAGPIGFVRLRPRPATVLSRVSGLLNVVALYLYVLHRQVISLPGWCSVGVLFALSVLTFVPTRYLYGTTGGRLNFVANLLGLIWAVLLTWMVYRLPHGEEDDPGHDTWWPMVVVISLLFPLAYFAVSWYVSWKLWRLRSGSQAGGAGPAVQRSLTEGPIHDHVGASLQVVRRGRPLHGP